MNEVLHPVKDAARQLGISIWTLRKKAYDREIGSVKIGSKLLIPASEIDWLIQSGMRPRRSHGEVPVLGLVESRRPADAEAQTRPRCEGEAT